MSTAKAKKQYIFLRGQGGDLSTGGITAPPLRDVQREHPSARCRWCGAERYRWDGATCPVCAAEMKKAEEGKAMTLYEMSKEYRAQAGALHDRIKELEARFPVPEQERGSLEARIRVLNVMRREARDLAMLTEHYYERGYRRNVRYTV